MSSTRYSFPYLKLTAQMGLALLQSLYLCTSYNSLWKSFR